MASKSRVFKVVTATAVVAFTALAIFAGYIFLRSRSGEGPLAIRWEGLFIRYNDRDMGTSFNQCFGKPVLREGLIERSNVWFSGWSCDAVGNPDVIYSLNHDPKRNELYFCHDHGRNNIGRFFNSEKRLNDLEFLETWDDPVTRHGACGFFKDSFEQLVSGKRLLIHCDAGKDRTGTYAALVTALALESRGLLNEQALTAIECDYRKSDSLEPDKFGRMQEFIEVLQARGGVAHFFQSTCGIEASLLNRVSEHLLEPFI